MKPLALLLAFLAPLNGFAACARDDAPAEPAAAADGSEFLRFIEEEDGSARLETAIARYRDEQGRIVDLVAAVHVGDADYYELLNALFRRYDALLYEAVAPKDVRPQPGHDSAVSVLQRAIKDLLQLEFQLDAIDYAPANFVHADLEPDEFFELMDERGENLLTLMLSVMLAELKRTSENPEQAQAQQFELMLALLSQDRARNLKKVLGRQFGDIEAMAAGLEKGLGGEESVLVVERNKAALRALDDRLAADDENVGIFYGAAHLPDLERRLRARGFEKVGEEWLEAWTIPARPADPNR